MDFAQLMLKVSQMTAGESVWLSYKAAERAGDEQKVLKIWP